MNQTKISILAAFLTILAVGTEVCHAQNQDFILANATGKLITAVYLGTSDRQWSKDDFLGDDVLPDGYEKFIRLARHSQTDCELLVRVYFADGTMQTSSRTENLCATYRLTVIQGAFLSD